MVSLKKIAPRAMIISFRLSHSRHLIVSVLGSLRERYHAQLSVIVIVIVALLVALTVLFTVIVTVISAS